MDAASRPSRQPLERLLPVLALAAPVAWVLLGDPRLERAGLGDTPRALAGMALLWLLALGVAVALRSVERRSWASAGASLGLRPPARRALLPALGVGLLLMLLVPLLSAAAAALLPAAAAGSGVAEAAARPWWLLLLGVVTAAVCEEVLFRAYPTERLGRRGAALGLAAFVLLHAGGWNAAHVLGVVLPLGAALTGLYLWRRDLVFVVIVHAVIDLPLVALALLG